MKKLMLAIIFLPLLWPQFSCKKNTAVPGPIGALAISGWSPAKPYFGDELTIRGSGFDPNPAANEVLMDGSVNCTIVSASATELKIIVPDLSSTLTPGYYSYIIVRVGGNEVVSTDPVYFARPLNLIAFTGSSNGTYFPGDSMVVEGSGFYITPDYNHIRLVSGLGNNITEYSPIQPVWIDSSYYTKMHCFYRSADCIGGDSSTPDSASVLAYFVLTVSGHEVNKPIRIAKFPRMQVAYVLHDANPVNTFRVVNLRYKSILPGTYITFSGPVNRTYEFEQIYSDDVHERSLQFQGSDLPAGTYTMSVIRNNVLYMSEIIGFN